MRITEAQLRRIIREELGSSTDLIGDAMAHIEAAGAGLPGVGTPDVTSCRPGTQKNCVEVHT
jgi:hypothetical protein